MYLNMNKYGKFSLSSFDIYIIKILKETLAYHVQNPRKIQLNQEIYPHRL